MRILIICESFLSIGGVPELVDNLSCEFARAGHQVAIVSRPPRGPLAQRAPRPDVETICIYLPGRKPVTWRHPERLFRSGRATDLIKFGRQWRPDVINLQGGLRDRYPAVIDACEEIGAPVVVSLHDYLGEGVEPKYALQAMESADAVTFLSSATRSSFERFSAGAKYGEVIIGGVDCAAAEQAAASERSRAYVLCAARIHLKHKALDVLVRAFRMIADENPDVDLVIAGDGSDMSEVRKLIASEGLSRRVELAGAVPRRQLWSLYKGALLFAMPSRKPEGLGLAFLEAMACGKPVIGSRSGGTPEIVVHGKTGMLLDQNEPDELAGTLRLMLGNRELREAMGRTAKDLVAHNHSWPVVACRYMDVFTWCIERRQAMGLQV